MDISGKRFLVIGGAGFIGSHIVDSLLEEDVEKVIIYDNFSRGCRSNLNKSLSDSRTEIFLDGSDILHKDTLMKAMEGIDGVFHLAALWLLECNEYPRSAFDVNVVGTMNIIEAAISCGVSRFVFSSSASVYGNTNSKKILEDSQLNCDELYGASKVCGEMIIKALFNREYGKNFNNSYVGLRYMNVYGPRQNEDENYGGVVSRMLNLLDSGKPPIIHGDGSQSYDFVYVQDCARSNILAMKSDSKSALYNIGSGIKTSINELAIMLSELHPSQIKPIFRTAERPFVHNRFGSTKKAQEEIGFEAKYRLREGLMEYLKYRESNKINGINTSR